MGWRTEPSGTPAEETPLRSPKGVRPIRRSFSINILPTKNCELEFRNPEAERAQKQKVPEAGVRAGGAGSAGLDPGDFLVDHIRHGESIHHHPEWWCLAWKTAGTLIEIFWSKQASHRHKFTCRKTVYGFIKSEISNSTVSTDSTNCYCYRCLQKEHSGEEIMWEDKLWEHQIRGWRAISAAGLQGKCSHIWVFFGQTPKLLLLLPHCY